MEPNSPERNPNLNFPEFRPSQASPEQLSKSHEQEVNRSEKSTETIEQQAPAQPILTPVQLPNPVPIAQVDDSNTTASDDNPAHAGDEDVIEKEWVDKIKKVIADTKEDPYRREREVNKLQADYIRKRYGKELGKS